MGCSGNLRDLPIEQPIKFDLYSLDHLVSKREQFIRDVEVEGLGGQRRRVEAAAISAVARQSSKRAKPPGTNSHPKKGARHGYISRAMSFLAATLDSRRERWSFRRQ
jgi:hypothetical protein